MNINQKYQETRHIGIVGFGPKGLYALARLMAEMWHKPWNGSMEVHVFEQGGQFGAGEVYRPDQPAYLKMNIPVSDVMRSIKEALSPLPEVLKDMESLAEDYRSYEFMPRAQTGKLLMQAFANMKSELLPGVVVREWHGEVTDIVRGGATAKIAFCPAAASENPEARVLPYHFHHILLATGHPCKRAMPEALLPFCRSRRTPAAPSLNGGAMTLPCYEPSVYPVQHLAASAKADATVIIRGMGLTFVDAVLALTEGRGGQFVESSPQRYRYLPSGKEPKRIVPFSRSGRLMPARAALQMGHSHQLCFFTPDFAERLLKKKGGHIDFEADLWPIIEAEYLAAYYGCLMPAHGYDLALDEVCSLERGVGNLRSRIAAFHKKHRSLAAFAPRAYLQGKSDLMEAGGMVDYHRYCMQTIAGGIDAALAGPEHSPLAAVVNVWRALSPVFNTLYSGGGLDSDSHKAFDAVMNGKLQCLSYGPCAQNMKKVLALAVAGIVDFGIGPGATLYVDSDGSSLVLQPHLRHRFGSAVTGDLLIEARIPRLSMDGHLPPLYASLMKSGQLRLFENRSEKGSYRPGCADMDCNGRAIDRTGRLHPVLTFAGTPTEGYFYDNDTLSPSRNNTVDAWARRIRDSITQRQGYEYAHRNKYAAAQADCNRMDAEVFGKQGPSARLV